MFTSLGYEAGQVCRCLVGLMLLRLGDDVKVSVDCMNNDVVALFFSRRGRVCGGHWDVGACFHSSEDQLRQTFSGLV